MTTDTQPTPEAIALATAILQRRAEHAAKKAERAAQATPVAHFDGIDYPLGSPVFELAGYPTRIDQIGVIAGVCLTNKTKIVVAKGWHTGAPTHRYENSKEDKRRVLGCRAWATWGAAHEALLKSAQAEARRAQERLIQVQAEVERVAAMVRPDEASK